MLVLNDNFWRDLMLDALETAVAGPHTGALSGLVIHLFTAPTVVNPDMTFAQLTLAAYTGYAPSGVIAWGTPYRRDDGAFSVTGAELTFRMGDGAVPTTVVGAALVLPGATPLLYGGEVFDVPRGLVNVDDVVIVIPTITLKTDDVGGFTILP